MFSFGAGSTVCRGSAVAVVWSVVSIESSVSIVSIVSIGSIVGSSVVVVAAVPMVLLDLDDCNARCSISPPARSAAEEAEPRARILLKLSDASLRRARRLEFFCFVGRPWFLGRMPVRRVACSSIGYVFPSMFCLRFRETKSGVGGTSFV